MINRLFMPENGQTMKTTYIWTVLAGLIYAGSSFLMSMAVSNILGVYAAGVFAIAMSIGNQLVTVGYYNMRTFQVSDVTEKYSFADYAGFRAVTVVIMLLAGAVWIFFGGYQGEKMAAIVLMLGFKAGEAISDLLEGRYQQKGRYDVSCRGVFFKTILYLVCFVVVLMVTKNILAATTALAVSYLISIVVIDHVLIGSFGGFSIRFSVKAITSLFISCLPIFLNSFFMTYIVNAAKYSMDRFYSNDFLGIFNALYMMGFVVNLFSNFVLKPLIMPLSVKFNNQDYKGFIQVMKRQVLIICGITVICVAGAYLLGIPVLTLLFGIDLSGYRLELCIILLGGSFTAIYQLFQYGIVIMRHQTGCLTGCMITAALTFLFTPVLVKQWGIFGASVSYLASMLLMSVVLLLFFVYYFVKERKGAAK